MPKLLSDDTKIALSHAEASSQRCRWITFMMQIAVILVIAATWGEADHNWLTLRLTTAQHAVWMLSCEPAAVYGDRSSSQNVPNSAPPGTTSSTSEEVTAEAREAAHRCERQLSPQDKSQALTYLRQWNFSLPEAKKNVADLQQLMATRVLSVTVPVLGMSFDINDLSVVAGFTFSILLSWFHFSLRRQHENIKQLFHRARQNGELEEAYELLSMTQVLTLPRSRFSEAGSHTLRTRLVRLPSLIMCTAAIAESIVIVDDFVSMTHGDVLSHQVSWTETSIAALLLTYIVVRTSQCFRMMGRTYGEWEQAFASTALGSERT